MYWLIDLIIAISSMIFLLFIPGFSITLAFYPKKDDLNILERIILSFGLGIAVIPICIFYINKLAGIPINSFTTILLVIIVSVLPAMIWYRRTRKGKR